MSNLNGEEDLSPLETIEFGQIQPIHVAIRNLIHDYPRDEGILKELIQNADDGGASEVRFILDLSARNGSEGPVPAWSEFGEPAILAINNAPFSTRDLERIRRLGDSGKVESPSETGKYGRGFNAVYNITDTPLLLTGNSVGFFDPCGWFAETGKSGKGWSVDEKFLDRYPDALRLFETANFAPGEDRHSASAFRFPLRSRLRGQSHHDRISDELFESTEFERLVKGLASLAEHLILFLRNIRFIGCYVCLDGKNDLETLLEITTLNEAEVVAGRGRVNEILSAGGVGEVLDLVAESKSGHIEAIYPHEIQVSRPEKISHSKWMVCTGLYAGTDNRLINQARNLNEAHNRAIPSAGAAVCVARDGETFPAITGTVSCFLPLSKMLGGAHLPFHINGAFDLDGSRTGITRTQDGQSGSTRDRAEWNRMLVADAVAPASARLIEACRAMASSAGELYRVFPDSAHEFPEPFTDFSSEVFETLSRLEVFGTVDFHWVKSSDLRLIPSDPDLHRCLATEKLPIPDPPLPESIRNGLDAIDSLPEQLSAVEIRSHFCLTEPGSWTIDEAPFEGLRCRRSLQALARFLASFEPKIRWEGLPLALCQDGNLRTFKAGEDDPFFIASDEFVRIFPQFQEWFLDSEFVLQSRLPESGSLSFRKMESVDFIDCLSHVTGESDSGPTEWIPDGDIAPNRAWLVEVLKIVNGFDRESDDVSSALKSAAIIPGNDGCLHRPGDPLTPLLVQITQQPLVEVLQLTSTPHWILYPQDPITKALSQFRERYDIVWPLTQWDLVDTLHAKKSLLSGENAPWKTDTIVSRLLSFLQLEIKNTEFNKGRLDKLSVLPLFKDTFGRYGPVDEATFLAGGFELPEVKVPFRLLSEGGHGALLRSLGVTEITRRRLLEECILPHLEELEDESLVGVMMWVRDEWNHLVHEFDEERELVSRLAGVACLISTDGERRAPDQLYHPSSQYLVEGLLGNEAHFPHRRLYGQDGKLWLRFFDLLRLAKSPHAQDLVDFIEGVIGRVGNEETTVREEERSLTEILRHVTDNWGSLASENVEAESVGECEFHEFLADTEWIVPSQIESKLFVPLAVEDRLYSPEELLSATQVPRAGSTRCFFPRSIREFSPDIREKLRVSRIPSVSDICEHLRNITSLYGDRPVEGAQLEEMRKLVAGIYRALGEHHQAANESGDSGKLAEIEAICAPLSNIPCLFVTSEKRFRRPRDVYRIRHQRLSPLKSFYRSDESLVESGLDLLGRCEEPTVEDLAEALVELDSESRQLTGAEIDAAVASLRLIKQKCEEHGAPLEKIEVRVPNAVGFLVDPEELFFEDDPGLASQLVLDNQLVLHRDAPFDTGLYRVARLSGAVAKPVGTLSESNDASFIRLCQRIEETIQSDAFSEGICRIQQHEGTFFNLAHLRWLARARVTPLESVNCRFVIELGSGREVDLGRATVDVAYDQSMGDGGTFLVGERSCEVIHNRFADALARELEPSPRDKAPLVTILNLEPLQIHHILDRLGLPGLREAAFEEDCEDQDFEVDTLPDEDGEIEPNPETSNSEKDGDPEEAQEPEVEEENEEEGSQDEGEPKETDGDESDDDESEDDESEDDESEDDESEDDESEDDESEGENIPRQTQRTRNGRLRRKRRQDPEPGDKDKSGEDENTPPERRTRGGGGGGTGPRGRMERGIRRPEGKSGGNVNRLKRSAQDDFWISRPKTKQQVEQSKQQNDEGDDEAPRNHSIGDAAVGWVLQYERQQGRRPQNMAHANPGYDIESRRGRIVERFIEVKGIDGEWGKNGVPLSSLQFFKSQDPPETGDEGSPPIGDRFWLYVVENARDPEKVKIHMIQNPAEKATEFRFDCGWKQAGETVEDFRPLFPTVGMRIVDLETDEEGIITRLDPNEYLMVKFENGPAKTVIYRSCDYELFSDDH